MRLAIIPIGLVLGVLSGCAARQGAIVPPKEAKRAPIQALGGPALNAPAAALHTEMKIHLINVGQGAATLLEFPCGAVLVDTGGENNTGDALVTYLDAFFVRRTDLDRTIAVLFVTHPHIDHARNVAAVT